MTSQALLQQINQLLNQGEYIAAHPLIVRLVTDFADTEVRAEGYFLLGIVNAEVGQFNKAVKCLEQAKSLHPKAEYHAYLCKCYALLGDSVLALNAADAISPNDLSQPHALDTVGVALSRLGFHAKALDFFASALALDSTKAVYFYNYGMSLKFSGDFTGAKRQFKQALEIDPVHAPTQFALSDMPKHSEHEQRITTLTELLTPPPENPDTHLHLAHALAIELQFTGQHPQALDVLTQAKQAKLSVTPYDFSRDQAIFTACEQWEKPKNTQGCASQRPIFIVGMPRSGTTLVERILSHHSTVGSGGELQDFGIAVKQLTQTKGQLVLCPDTIACAQDIDMQALGQNYIEKTRRIAPDKAHFIDKLPFNFFYIDLIKASLPNAKIIVMLREPMDTCLGNFRQMFSLNSPYYQYAFALESIGDFYIAFRQHIDLMQSRYGDAIRVQDYEQLAKEPESQVRELLSFCELDFEAQCLHVEQNPTPVSTASKVQVREPINTSSIGRWKKFGPKTTPLHDKLKAHKLV